MAPNQYDISDLSPRNRAIFLAGVRGADGDDTAAEDPTAEAVADEATEATADEATEATEATEAAEGSTLPDLPADLATADPESLSALYEEYGALRDEARANAASPADIERIRDITSRRQAISAEFQRRLDERRQVDEGLAALDAELAEEGVLPAPAMALASMTPATPSAAQVAAARGAQTASAQTPPPSAPTGVKVALTASISGDDFGVGQEMSMSQFGSALDRVKRGGGRTVVASLAPFDEMTEGSIPALLSNDNGATRNTALMREAQDAWRARRQGDVRAAAICEPLDVIRQIPDAFVTAEPVRDIFPSRPAGRLGFTFVPSVVLSDVWGGTGLWDDTDQGSVDPDVSSTWKECLDVDCPTPETITADAVTACLTWDLTTEMSNPEYVANLLNALNAARARRKEGRILQRVDALSHHYTFASAYGAMPALVKALNEAVAQAVYADRQAEPDYTVILPPGLVQLLTIDMTGRAYTSDDVADVLAYLRSAVDGVGSVVRSLDASAAGQPGLPFAALNPVGGGAVPLPSLDGDHRVRLLDPGAALYAETGALNVGTTRDSQLLRQNKTQYFAEEFLLLAKSGPQPWFTLDVTLCADGARAGFIEPVGCTS